MFNQFFCNSWIRFYTVSMRGTRYMSFFLDLANAFDKVPHKKLLEKLKKHGIRGKLFSVIGSL